MSDLRPVWLHNETLSPDQEEEKGDGPGCTNTKGADGWRPEALTGLATETSPTGALTGWLQAEGTGGQARWSQVMRPANNESGQKLYKEAITDFLDRILAV